MKASKGECPLGCSEKEIIWWGKSVGQSMLSLVFPRLLCIGGFDGDLVCGSMYFKPMCIEQAGARNSRPF